MKLRVFSLLFIFLATQVSAQELVNLNPDKGGEPWYVGKLRTLTEDDYKKIAQTPKLKMPKSYNKSTLPAVVDNSLNKYFRPVFNQQNGSCGQASGVGYNFTYAINYARDLPANTTMTQYPSHYTYNFLNNGADNGSFYFDGWEIIDANGCPDVMTYGGTPWALGLTGWMSGYNKYYSGMKNRLLEMFTVDLTTPEGLLTLKAWMNDQLNGSLAGGLANFSAGVSGSFSMGSLAYGTPEQNKRVITHWDSEINHAMTFVGYNDNIRFDFNGDGQYTNDKDINGDAVIDMRDWEIGGLIMVNSWGTSWGDQGKAYVPYRLLAEPSTNGGIGTGLVYAIRAKATYEPKVTVKASITYNSRKKLRITAGASANPDATRPDKTIMLPLFNFQGGDLYMKGGQQVSDQTIEIGIDITPVLSFINSGESAKIFLVVEEKDPSGTSSGTINSFSVIDYTNGAAETICQQSNVNIQNNDTTFLSVNKSIVFDKVQISTAALPDVIAGIPYSYTMNAQSGTPPYKWSFAIDYSEKESTARYLPVTNNTLSPAEDDDSFARLTLPFSFPFYNKKYSDVIVTTDGSILFGDKFEYVRDISALRSIKAITGYGSDLMLYHGEGDGMWYFSSKDSVTVRWRTSKYDNAAFNAEFSITLLPSGQINFSYGSGITSSTDWVAGISNGDGVSYNKLSISGNNTVSANQRMMLFPSGFPTGMEMDKNGVINLTTTEGDKEWTVTTSVTDMNKISTVKTFTLHSVESLGFSPDTLKFDSPVNPDPWQTGKTLTVSNICDQAVSLSKLDWEGIGWEVSDAPLSYPYALNPGESLSLTVKLKTTYSKSSAMIRDTLNVETNFVSYPVHVLIDPALYTASVFPVEFTIEDSNGPVAGAIISIEKLTNPLLSDSEGKASIALPQGSYKYYISFGGHLPLSGEFVVNNTNQTVVVFLSVMGIDAQFSNAINVYPNPFTNELIVSGLKGKVQLSVAGFSGNTVLTRQTSGEVEKIDTSELPAGIYFLTIENSKGQKAVKKVIKK